MPSRRRARSHRGEAEQPEHTPAPRTVTAEIPVPDLVKELVLRAHQGDTDAVETLVATIGSQLFGLATLILGNAARAERSCIVVLAASINEAPAIQSSELTGEVVILDRLRRIAVPRAPQGPAQSLIAAGRGLSDDTRDRRELATMRTLLSFSPMDRVCIESAAQGRLLVDAYEREDAARLLAAALNLLQPFDVDTESRIAVLAALDAFAIATEAESAELHELLASPPGAHAHRQAVTAAAQLATVTATPVPHGVVTGVLAKIQASADGHDSGESTDTGETAVAPVQDADRAAQTSPRSTSRPVLPPAAVPTAGAATAMGGTAPDSSTPSGAPGAGSATPISAPSADSSMAPMAPSADSAIPISAPSADSSAPFSAPSADAGPAMSAPSAEVTDPETAYRGTYDTPVLGITTQQRAVGPPVSASKREARTETGEMPAVGSVAAPPAAARAADGVSQQPSPAFSYSAKQDRRFEKQRRRNRRRRNLRPRPAPWALRISAMVLALALLATTAGWMLEYQRVHNAHQFTDSWVELSSQPGSREVVGESDNGTWTAVFALDGVALRATDVRRKYDGEVMQLWATSNDSIVDLGVIKPDRNGVIIVTAEGAADSLFVTRESRPGNRSGTPSKKIVADINPATFAPDDEE